MRRELGWWAGELARRAGHSGGISLLCLMPQWQAVHWNTVLAAHARQPQLWAATHSIFARSPERNVVSWNTLVAGMVRCGALQEAAATVQAMPGWTVVTWTPLFHAYARQGHMQQAQWAFDSMPDRDHLCWNLMLHAQCHHGREEQAKSTFDALARRDVVAFTALLAAYARRGHLHQARSIFAAMPRRDAVSWTTMLQACVAAGSAATSTAKLLFDSSPQRSIVAWTLLLEAHTRAQQLEEARALLARMCAWDIVSWTAALVAVSQLAGSLDEAAAMFHKPAAPPPNVVTWSAMLTAYVRHGRLADSKRHFDSMPQRNPVSWNALLTGYAQQQPSQADQVLSKMPAWSAVSWNIVLALHAAAGRAAAAKSLFDAMPEQDRTLSSWNAIMAAYAHHAGLARSTLSLFHHMLLAGRLAPDELTFTTLLLACSRMALLHEARHHLACSAVDFGVRPTIDHYCCMVDLLARSGRLEQAEELVTTMPFLPNDVVWACLASACNTHGDMERATRVAHSRLDQACTDHAAPYITFLAAAPYK